jgi:hypothetical protein
VEATTTEHDAVHCVDRVPRRSCPCISVAHIPEQVRLFHGLQLTTSRMKCNARRFFLADPNRDNKGGSVVLDTTKSVLIPASFTSAVTHLVFLAFSSRWSELKSFCVSDLFLSTVQYSFLHFKHIFADMTFQRPTSGRMGQRVDERDGFCM